jgi:branched-chain amino acid transport system permease protein
MIIMGGMGSILGSIYGAIFITFLPEFIRMIANLLIGHSSPEFSTILAYIQQGSYGVFIVLFLIFEPRGIYGIWLSIKNYFRMWPFSY